MTVASPDWLCIHAVLPVEVQWEGLLPRQPARHHQDCMGCPCCAWGLATAHQGSRGKGSSCGIDEVIYLPCSHVVL